jgi:hypothetical protein
MQNLKVIKLMLTDLDLHPNQLKSKLNLPLYQIIIIILKQINYFIISLIKNCSTFVDLSYFLAIMISQVI